MSKQLIALISQETTPSIRKNGGSFENGNVHHAWLILSLLASAVLYMHNGRIPFPLLLIPVESTFRCFLILKLPFLSTFFVSFLVAFLFNSIL